MKKNEAYYRHLTDLYVSNKCSPAEMKELFAWLKDTEANKILLEKIREEFNLRMSQGSSNDDRTPDEPVADRSIPLDKKHWFGYAAAACILLFLVGGYNYYRYSQKAIQNRFAKCGSSY